MNLLVDAQGQLVYPKEYEGGRVSTEFWLVDIRLKKKKDRHPFNPEEPFLTLTYARRLARKAVIAHVWVEVRGILTCPHCSSHYSRSAK